MRRKKSEKGSTILESLVCIMLLCLLFFGLMQIFQWAMAKMLCEYSSFYVAKAASLGYAQSIVRRAGRVSIMGASGKDISGTPVKWAGQSSSQKRLLFSEIAQEYMQYSDLGPHAINFEYWDPSGATSDTPEVEIPYPDRSGRTVEGRVRVDNMPLLHEDMKIFLGGASKADIPSGTSRTFNHSRYFLEGN